MKLYANTVSWGIGAYVYKNEIGEEEVGYGYFHGNPHDFTPDPELCSAEEIAAWEKAKEDLK